MVLYGVQITFHQTLIWPLLVVLVLHAIVADILQRRKVQYVCGPVYWLYVSSRAVSFPGVRSRFLTSWSEIDDDFFSFPTHGSRFCKLLQAEHFPRQIKYLVTNLILVRKFNRCCLYCSVYMNRWKMIILFENIQVNTYTAHPPPLRSSFLLPSTSIIVTLSPTYSSSLLMTCPYHFNPLSCTFEID